MKRVILSAAIVLFFSGITSAQTSAGGSGSRTTGAVSSTGSENGSTKKGSKSKKGAKKTAQMNERREYKGQNGQTATPTGHDATGTGSTNATLGKDSVRRKQENP